MPATCSNIHAGFVMDNCEDGATPGTSGRILLINYADIDRALSKMSATDANVIEDLILKEGATAYEVDSMPGSAVLGESGLVVGTYKSGFSHSVTGRIFKKNEDAKTFINQLPNALIVALVENMNRGDAGDTKYEVYGWDNGLRLTEHTGSTDMPDDAPYTFVIATGENAREATLPKSFFKTDEATTDTAVDALLIAPTNP